MQKITENNTIEEILVLYPQAIKVFLKYGIPAISCGEPIWGTIKENAEKYGVKNLKNLIEELNEIIEKGSKLNITFEDSTL
ncbi:MAG: hypothetical protein ABDH37_05400 [Candidatus Hydrothermales bacterium]